MEAERKKKAATIVMYADTYKKLKLRAVNDETTMSALVEEWVSEKLADGEKTSA